MDKEDEIYVNNGMLFSHKKEWNNATCSNMDGPRECHTEWSQTEKENIWHPLYVESKNKWHKQMYKTERDSQTWRMNLWLPVEGWVDELDGEFVTDMYTLLYLKWIIRKDLLYSSWNSAQCYVAAWMGGKFGGRMDTYSLLCSPETITTLLISYTPIQNKKFENNLVTAGEGEGLKTWESSTETYILPYVK